MLGRLLGCRDGEVDGCPVGLVGLLEGREDGPDGITVGCRDGPAVG